jgi:hypothetical protein
MQCSSSSSGGSAQWNDDAYIMPKLVMKILGRLFKEEFLGYANGVVFDPKKHIANSCDNTIGWLPSIGPKLIWKV